MWYKVKKIYQWSNQVRPAPLYKYEYDFRNKTISQLESDGWVFLKDKSVASITSDWLFAWNNNDNTVIIKKDWLQSMIQSANKITIKFKWKTTFWQLSSRIMVTATSSSRTNPTWWYIQLASSIGAWDSVYRYIYWTSSYQTITKSSYDNIMFTQTCIIDFVNKTLSITDDIWFSKTVSLTDTQISNIKNNSTCLMPAVWWYATMQSTSITME